MKNEKALKLFGEWAERETILLSCLDGTMGEIAGTSESAAAVLGDFAFFAGKPDMKLAEKVASEREFFIAVPQNADWESCIENAFGARAKKVVRYAFLKNTPFDREKLEKFAENIPTGFTVRRIGEKLYRLCAEGDFSHDLVSNFPTFDDYENLGIGFAALTADGTLAAGASSYSSYDGGIEIEIDTHPDFRRRGLAKCLAATLILACLDRGIYPSWDAQNTVSAHLAETLGYAFDREYTAYEVI